MIFSSRVEFRIKSSPIKSSSSFRSNALHEELYADPDDLLAAHFDDYGTTPPRTRMKIKNRDWDRKQKAHAVASAGA